MSICLPLLVCVHLFESPSPSFHHPLSPHPGGVLLAMIEGINIMFTRFASEQFKPQPPAPAPDNGPPQPIYGSGGGATPSGLYQ